MICAHTIMNLFDNLKIGGATALIGDPSGKTKERVAMAEELARDNSHVIRENIQRIFDNHQKYIWEKNRNPSTLKPLKYFNFLPQ